MDDIKKLIEQVEVLDGKRPRAREQGALRLADLQGLMDLPQRLQSGRATGATPTKAEFDALVADFAEMHKRMVAVINALQQKLV